MNSNFFKGQQLTLNIHFARIILIFLIISVSLWGIAGCEQANTTSGQSTTTPVSSSSTSSPQPSTTGQSTTTASSVSTTTTKATTNTTTTTTTTTATTKPRTTESSQTNQKTKFSQADLTINGVPVNATPAEAELVLGKPETTSTAMDQLTGLDVMTNSYDGLQLLFMNDAAATNVFKLKYVEVMDEKYTLARGLKIGMSTEAALQLFFAEQNPQKYQIYSILYGNPAELDQEEAKGALDFAYYNKDGARFVHMEPPYMSGTATIYDEMALLILSFEDNKLAKAFWMLGAGAE